MSAAVYAHFSSLEYSEVDATRITRHAGRPVRGIRSGRHGALSGRWLCSAADRPSAHERLPDLSLFQLRFLFIEKLDGTVDHSILETHEGLLATIATKCKLRVR